MIGKDSTISKALHHWGFWAAITLSLYVLLNQKYQMNNIDDAWVLSWAHSLWNNETRDDVVFGRDNPGQGLRLFGVAYAWMYGTVLALIGWSKGNSHLISSLLVVSGSPIFYISLKKLQFPTKVAFASAAVLPLFEPIFSSGQTSRTDALTFFFCMLSFYLGSTQKWFLGVIVACVAFETHPSGTFSFFYLLAAFLAIAHRDGNMAPRDLAKKVWETIPSIGLGLTLGSLYYLFLHWPYLGEFSQVLHLNQTPGQINNFLFSYFFLTKYYRHLPELGLITCGILYLLKQYRRNTKQRSLIERIFFISGAVLLGTIIVTRPNFRYTALVCPVFLVILALSAEISRRKTTYFVIVLAILLPQYGYVAYRHRGYQQQSLTTQLKSLLPNPEKPILGCADCWYAFQDDEFYHYQHNHKGHLETFYLIEDDYFRDVVAPWFDARYTKNVVGSFKIGSSSFVVSDRARKKADEATRSSHLGQEGSLCLKVAKP